MCSSGEASAQRRSSLRLITLVLDGLDESIDHMASQLAEVSCPCLLLVTLLTAPSICDTALYPPPVALL